MNPPSYGSSEPKALKTLLSPAPSSPPGPPPPNALTPFLILVPTWNTPQAPVYLQSRPGAASLSLSWHCLFPSPSHLPSQKGGFCRFFGASILELVLRPHDCNDSFVDPSGPGNWGLPESQGASGA